MHPRREWVSALAILSVAVGAGCSSSAGDGGSTRSEVRYEQESCSPGWGQCAGDLVCKDWRGDGQTFCADVDPFVTRKCTCTPLGTGAPGSDECDAISVYYGFVWVCTDTGRRPPDSNREPNCWDGDGNPVYPDQCLNGTDGQLYQCHDNGVYLEWLPTNGTCTQPVVSTGCDPDDPLAACL